VPRPITFPSRTGARLGRAFLLYLIAIAGLVTLIPFDFTRPAALRLLWQVDPADVAANAAMFLPLGFLGRLTWPAPRDRWALKPLLQGLALSLLLESAQLFLPSRFSSPVDVLSNGLGAWGGALAHDWLMRRLQPGPALAGRLALELPLMGLVYLLVPLLWINALAGFTRSGPPLSTLLIGLVGAIAMAQVYRHRFGPGRSSVSLRYAAAAAGWFVTGAFVLFLAKPFVGLTATAAIALVVLGWSGLKVSSGERRYEGDTLLLLSPLFVLYLAAIAGWPGWSLPSAARAANVGATAETTAILATLELLAAFTVLGYGVAEFRGRRELPFVRVAPVVAAVGAGVGVALELALAGRTGPGDLALRAALAGLAAVYGGGVYHLQRVHVRALLSQADRGPDRSETRAR